MLGLRPGTQPPADSGTGALSARPARHGPGQGWTRTRLDPRGAPLASDPRLETSPGLRGQIRFSLWTLPHWSGSPPKKSFFSKGICFRAGVIKPGFICSLFCSFTPLLTATSLSGQKIEYVLWCCTSLCSGYSESDSFPNFYWIPKL